MIKGPRSQIVKQFFPNGSIWLLGRRHQELGPAVGGCPGLPHGEAGPGRARLVGFPAAPTGAKGQLLCTGQKGPKRLSLSGWVKGGSGESWQPQSPPSLLHLHASVLRPRPPEASPTCFGVWAGEVGVKLDTSPVRRAAYGDQEGAAGRAVAPECIHSLEPLCPAQHN